MTAKSKFTFVVIRAMFKQAYKQNIVKHADYKLIQMVQEPSFFATDPRF